MVAKDTNQLRALFAVKGLIRQKQIASALFVSENTITRWFHGEAMSNSQAHRVAEFLGSTVADLFTTKAEDVPPATPAPSTTAGTRQQQRAALAPEAQLTPAEAERRAKLLRQAGK